jgi:hypothetical protein
VQPPTVQPPTVQPRTDDSSYHISERFIKKKKRNQD